jgi:hypothetical protein
MKMGRVVHSEDGKARIEVETALEQLSPSASLIRNARWNW